uniref:PKD domain-containing protein n=1 Tax=viral metagenome TaxID=1070528 RepID=A0A6M3XCL3_9ZZZZ
MLTNMKRILLILTTLLILLLPVSWAGAATYYVCDTEANCEFGALADTDWVTGNDGNAGTAKSTALKTINAAVAKCTAGQEDTIIVGAGTYVRTEGNYLVTFTTNDYGQDATHPWLLRAETISNISPEVCLDGGQSLVSHGAIRFVNSAHWIKVQGFEIKNFRYYGILGSLSAYSIEIDQCVIHDLHAWADDDLLTGLGLGVHTNHSTRDFTITRSNFHNNGRNPDGCTSSCTGSGCAADYGHDHHMYLQGSGHEIYNNVFYDNNAGWAISIRGYSGADDSKPSVTVINNTFYGSGYDFGRAQCGAASTAAGAIHVYTNFGQETAGGPRDCIFRNNVFLLPPEDYVFEDDLIDATRALAFWGSLTWENNVTTSAGWWSNPNTFWDTYDETAFTSFSGNHSGTTTPGILDHADLGMTAPSTNDFTLTASASYLINSGLATGAPDDDFLGIARPQDGADDVGAYEYASVNINPTVTIDTPSDPQSISTGAALNWTCTASDSDGTISTYLWEFGVGSGIANSSSEDPGNKTFNNAGNFTVRVTVTDNDGGTGTDTVSVTVAGAGTWTDIKFWWRFEASDFSATNGTLDYSAGDDIAADNGTPTYSAGADLVGDGGKALTLNAQWERVTFTTAIVNIWDAGTDLKIGFLWKTRDATDNTRILSFIQDGTHELLISQLTNDLGVIYDSAGTVASANTVGNHLTNGVVYYVEVTIDFEAGNDTLKIEYFTHAAGVSVESATDNDAAVTDFGTPTSMSIGDIGGTGTIDFDIDNLIISNDITRDIKAIRAYTSYPGGATTPTVTNVTCSTANGYYKDADTIGTFTVTFSESVTVVGTPVLTFETGATDATSNYTSGSPGQTLTFLAFTVSGASSHTTADLDAKTLSAGTSIVSTDDSTTAVLTLPTGATSGSLASNKAIVIDTTVPGWASVAFDSDCNGTADGGDGATYTTTNTSVCLLCTADENVTAYIQPGGGYVDLVDGTGVRFTFHEGIGTTKFIFKRVLTPGDRTLLLKLHATLGVQVATGLDVYDLAGNAMSDRDTNVANVDLGTSLIACPYLSTSPKEFDSVNTVAAWIAGTGYFLPNDFIECTEANSIGTVDMSGSDGTSGNVITIDGGGFAHAGNQTFGDYWTVKRTVHGSTVVLGLGDIHKYSLIPSADILQVPEGATGCTVLNNGIRGTLDLDEAANVYNSWITTLDVAGLAADEPVVFYNCAFVESQAVIEAKNAVDVLTFTDCLFAINTSTSFVDYAGSDFRPASGSGLIDVGYDTGVDRAIDGRGTPRDKVHDIGPYEYPTQGMLID